MVHEKLGKYVNAIECELNSHLNANLYLNANLSTKADLLNNNLALNAMNPKVTFINRKVICEKLYDVKCQCIKPKSNKANRFNMCSTCLRYRLLTKCSKLRRVVRKEIKQSISSSSCIDRYTQASSHQYQRITSSDCFHKFLDRRLNFRRSVSAKPQRHLKCNCKHATTRKFHCNQVFNKINRVVYKDSNHNHEVNYSKIILSGDIEVNPGPIFNNPIKTIPAPYGQGSVEVFGENAGHQCESMIYVFCNNSVQEASDLVKIMNLGNQLYSALSRLSKQRYLLLEELPTMVTVKETDYSVELSQSYIGNLHFPVVNDNVPFVMPLDCALERLQEEMFSSFLLTVECNTVSIFTDSNGLLKVFDSHARNSFGMPDAYGTCVLLEFDTTRNLTEYLKQLYRPGVIFEVKGVKINYAICNQNLENVDTDKVISYTSSDSDTLKDEIMNHDSDYNIAQNCYLFLYAICFSIIKSCSYWNDQTQVAIFEHGIELFDKLNGINPLLSSHLPESTQICDKTFDIVYTSRQEGILHCISPFSKDALAVVISTNTTNNTGFLISFDTDQLACIIQNKTSAETRSNRPKYFLLALGETRKLNLLKALPDPSSVVNRLCEYLNLNEPQLEQTEYILQFL